MRALLMLLVFLHVGVHTHGQSLRNGDFALRCDTCKTGLAGWDLSWAGRGVTCVADQAALIIRCQDSADAVGSMEQAVRKLDRTGGCTSGVRPVGRSTV